MSVFRLTEFDTTENSYILTVFSNSQVHQVLKSWKNSDIRLNPQTAYKFILLNLVDYSLSSVSFMTESIPFQEFSLPFYKSLDEDFFDLENFKASDILLSASNNLRPEEYISIDINYEIDDEPLVQLNCDKSHLSMEMHNESIISEAYEAKIENFEKLLENEGKMRKSAEEKLEEILKSYEKYLQESQNTEENLRRNIEELEVERSKSGLLISTLQTKLNESNFQLKSSQDSINFLSLKAKCQNPDNLKEELQVYKALYEKSEKKIQEILRKVEEQYENDPISLLLKDKDDAVSKVNEENGRLNEELNKIKEKIAGHQVCLNETEKIEKKFQEAGNSFVREKDMVYSVNGSKVVVFLQEDRLLMRKISGFYQLESKPSSPAHKRSNTDFKPTLPSTLKRPPVSRITSPYKKTGFNVKFS